MSISFPAEALKAQAVIARSYALYRTHVVRPHRKDGFDLCDSQHCQVYRGASNEWVQTTAAVDETRGEVLMSGGRLASPLFHANCGVHTQSSRDLKGWGEVPYLTGVLDGPPDLSFPSSPASLERWLKSRPAAYCGTEPFNAGPEFRWFRLIPADLLQEKLDRLRGVGRIGEVRVLGRTSGGYVQSVRIEGTRSSILIEKEHEIRRILGLGPLRSNLFWIETTYDADGNPEEFLLYGGGWGHGVGLCQDGAGGMAAQGFEYAEILAHYYTGTDLSALDY
jgi:SpoIID/LytB domain protein